MSKLVICEKPSVAKAVASALGASSRADGFYEGSGLIVSWCVGHLVSPLDAGGYDERFKKWRYEDLPILPEPFRYAPIPGKEAALDNVTRLMAREDVTEIVNACDAGREGDYPFAAFITNLGKYNEGELVGEWVKFPTTAEEMKEVFRRIGIGQKDEFGQPYEEWFITDYDCYVDGLYDKLGEYENLDELNYLASKLEEMRDYEYAQFRAGMEMGDHCGSLQEIINLTENLDCYEIYPNTEDYDDLGRYYIEELDVMQVPEHLRNYIDYEAYGRDVALEEGGAFTDQGYVRDTGNRFREYYDGERGSIPDEYRVMTFQDDLPEEEKSEWAMDLAYDLDEFFRQRDPQYAADHPDAHEAKEELHEKLMAGRISALEEKLAALGQTQEDHLPSEIEKFKDATGYEEFLDFDPAEVKAALEDPDRSRVAEMLAAAERAEREYAAQAAAYVQTPAAIAEQARAEQPEPVGSFSIYQLRGGDETRDYRYESLDSLRRNGLSVQPENYELVYEAPLTAKDDLESIYTRFNVDRPADFTGHSLSVSDIVVLHQDGKDAAHYCDRAAVIECPHYQSRRVKKCGDKGGKRAK